jgi:hypothetical protein
MKKDNKKAQTFDSYLQKSWEDADGVNFAIALARITGWLLHVDWFTPNNDEGNENNMKSLRVYVGDDEHNVFDLRGKFKITSFAQQVILPIAKARATGKGGVLTRFYSENKLMGLPLRVKPDQAKVKIAEGAILKNLSFLEKISIRRQPAMPAHLAANFSFGRCAIYATAMHDITNLPVTAVIADSYSAQFGYSKLGYAHSIILHTENQAEDSWGKQSIDRIISRYGIERYRLSEDEHWRVNESLKTNSKEKYEQAYNESVQLIKEFVLGTSNFHSGER